MEVGAALVLHMTAPTGSIRYIPKEAVLYSIFLLISCWVYVSAMKMEPVLQVNLYQTTQCNTNK
jgi:hypothetical protein